MINSLSVILPLYNEEIRLKKTFSQIIKFIRESKIRSKEFIFVDDGSIDNSCDLIKRFIEKNKNLKKTKFKLIKLQKNLGKGGALKKGIKSSTNQWILTSDIDFSVSLFELENWQKKKYISNSNDVYFGSRSHNSSNVNSKLYRKIIGIILRILISFFLGIKIRDTQCGFKLYKKRVAKKLFSNLKFYGYEHDIEIVLILKKKKVSIRELPVTWTHVNNSKVNIVTDSIKIFYKLFNMKLKYLFIN